MPGTVEENDNHKLEGISEHISDELSGDDERDDGGKIADSGEKFDFTLWTKNSGINRKTAALLRKEDLVTIEALVLLDDSDLKDLEMTIGQRKLFQSALYTLKGINCEEKSAADKHKLRVSTVKSTNDHLNSSVFVEKKANPADTCQNQDPPSIPRTQEPAGPTIADFRKQASQLQSSGKMFDSYLSNFTQKPENEKIIPITNSLSQSDLCAKPSDLSDPRTILTVKASSQKAKHITNFLPESVKRRLQSKSKKEWFLAKSGEGENLVIKQDCEHPYSGITLSEWSAANCRLLADLLRSGDLNIKMIEFYLAYSTQIYDFVPKYEWESILDFDFQYRERQAEYGFNWGSLTANMELQILIPRGVRQNPGNPGRGNNNNYRPTSRSPSGYMPN